MGADIGHEKCGTSDLCPRASIIEARIAALGGPATQDGTYRHFLTQVADDVIQPGGNMVVLGYPEIVELPQFWPLWAQAVGACWGMGPADALELRGLAGDLNATIGSAVADVNRSAPNGVHLRFIDVNSGSQGIPDTDQNLFEPSSGPRHNLCASQEWLNGLSGIDYTSGSFHPNQQGLDHEGALAATVISGLDWSDLKPAPWTGAAVAIPPGLQKAAAWQLASGSLPNPFAGCSLYLPTLTGIRSVPVQSGVSWKPYENPFSSDSYTIQFAGEDIQSADDVTETVLAPAAGIPKPAPGYLKLYRYQQSSFGDGSSLAKWYTGDGTTVAVLRIPEELCTYEFVNAFGVPSAFDALLSSVRLITGTLWVGGLASRLPTG